MCASSQSGWRGQTKSSPLCSHESPHAADANPLGEHHRRSPRTGIFRRLPRSGRRRAGHSAATRRCVCRSVYPALTRHLPMFSAVGYSVRHFWRGFPILRQPADPLTSRSRRSATRLQISFRPELFNYTKPHGHLDDLGLVARAVPPASDQLGSILSSGICNTVLFASIPTVVACQSTWFTFPSRWKVFSSYRSSLPRRRAAVDWHCRNPIPRRSCNGGSSPVSRRALPRRRCLPSRRFRAISFSLRRRRRTAADRCCRTRSLRRSSPGFKRHRQVVVPFHSDRVFLPPDLRVLFRLSSRQTRHIAGGVGCRGPRPRQCCWD